MTRLLSGLLFLLSLAGFQIGCNLLIDLESYPYPLPFPDDPLPPDAGIEADIFDDPQPRQGPQLLITEVMIRPSTPPDSTSELGEYIESQNVGDEPIHPRDIVIEILETNDRIYVDRLISTPEERDVFDSLQPIAPGAFFVFLRRDDPYYQITAELPKGSFYEYGRWHRSVSLSNFSRTLRLVEIQDEFSFQIHHQIGWREGYLVDLSGQSHLRHPIREDIAFGLRSGISDPDDAADITNWCYHTTRFGDGPLLGSPGRRTPDNCL